MAEMILAREKGAGPARPGSQPEPKPESAPRLTKGDDLTPGEEAPVFGPRPRSDADAAGLEQGAAEGAPFIVQHIIETSDVAFDDFAGGDADVQDNRRILGLD